MKKLLQILTRYRIQYLLFSFTIFFGGWFFAAGNKAAADLNFIICLLYATAITFNAVVIENYLLPRLLYTKKKLLFAAAAVLLILVSAFTIHVILSQLAHTMYLLQVKGSIVISFLLSYFFPLAFFAIATTIIAVLRKQQVTIIQYEKLQSEKLQAELSFLKAQINPHFLFNSLNSIYFQIDKQNNNARDTLLKFTELLRYQLYECNADKIAVKDEVNYLTNYITLQQLRKGEKYKIIFTANDNYNGLTIAPLLFITFAENAFKYVSNKSNGENYITITLQKEKEWLIFSCINTKDETSKPEITGYSGIGLVNTKKRLDILYGNNYILQTDDTSELYKVVLKIKYQQA